MKSGDCRTNGGLGDRGGQGENRHGGHFIWFKMGLKTPQMSQGPTAPAFAIRD